MSVKVLHFADAHIDSYTGGRIDSSKGFSFHTLDFFKALDEITDLAISEKVQLVLFAGLAIVKQTAWQILPRRASSTPICAGPPRMPGAKHVPFSIRIA